eukprot:Blabericola_migrator_1__4624@NODE_2450_length_2741_cov_35_320120_g1534_i0_p4_GENE_NODE_2450_length_2741_cov_35_320120_g1534_i0NODE_2450_length_2741_cov_35_320120_g1534_i0_p4_ORF_typecomplete_len118_score7_41AgrB/PF04647_15/0_2DUF4149/PF13664_6/0_73DUF4149/PF13664_6/4_4e02_NODE_2450_length_2741_cov_35_320120_g1534_i07581111
MCVSGTPRRLACGLLALLIAGVLCVVEEYTDLQTLLGAAMALVVILSIHYLTPVKNHTPHISTRLTYTLQWLCWGNRKRYGLPHAAYIGSVVWWSVLSLTVILTYSVETAVGLNWGS